MKYGVVLNSGTSVSGATIKGTMMMTPRNGGHPTI